jgi:hypothetical protein
MSRKFRVCITQGIDVGELPWRIFLLSLLLLPTLALLLGSPPSSPGRMSEAPLAPTPIPATLIMSLGAW